MANRWIARLTPVIVAFTLGAASTWVCISGPSVTSREKSGAALSKAEDHEAHDHAETQIVRHPVSGESRTHEGHVHRETAVGERIDRDHPDDHGDHGGHAGEDLVRIDIKDLQRYGIELTTARPDTLSNQLSLPGEVAMDAARMAHIVPKLAGTVREVRRNIGDPVKQGEIMAVIESRELADSKAEYLASLERVSLFQTRFERERKLWQKKISAEQEYLDARKELAEARITLRSAEQKLHALGFSDRYLKELPRHHDESYTRYEIVAPFDGTVVDKHITLGEMLKEDADAFLVADLSRVWVNLSVYQKDLPLVSKGQGVLISAGSGIPDARGTISYVSPIVREDTRTILARVALPNPDGHWRPGMFVSARTGVEEYRAPVAVPRTALQSLDDRTVVFVQTPEGFAARPVTTGRATEEAIEILSGLSAGERYVSKGSFTLKAQLSKGAFGHGHAH